MTTRRPWALVLLGVALSGAGFLAGFAYAVAAVPASPDSTDTDPLLLATLRSTVRTREEIAALKCDLEARAAPRRRAAPPESAAAPQPRSSALAAPGSGGAGPGSMPVAVRPTSSRFADGVDPASAQGARLYADLLAAARGEKDAAKRAAAVRGLAGMFGAQADGALSAIAADAAQPSEVRELATSLRSKAAEGSKR